MTSDVHSSLEAILETGAVRTVFQPVFDLSGASPAVHLLESLTRGPEGTNLEPAGVLFEYARRKGGEARLDRLCVKTAFASVPALPPGVRVSVNVHASTLERDLDFASFLVEGATASGLSPARVVVEIVEHAPSWDGPRFRKALDTLTESGVKIALDDIGLGQSNYRMILETRPHYFKLDRFLVAGCHEDAGRKAVLDSIVRLARAFGSSVIAEGPGCEGDIAAVREIGVDLVQGFILARPAPAAAASRFFDA